MSLIIVLLLLIIVWLLWQIHQDLVESNDRQRNLKTGMARLANQVEALLERERKPAAPRRSRSRTREKTEADS